MDFDQQIRIAAVIASLVTIVISVVLFALKELIERNRKRRKSARSLILYSNLALNAVSRDSVRGLPFAMKDVIECAQEILDVASISILVSELDRCLSALQRAEIAGKALDRSDRTNISLSLKTAIESTANVFNVIALPVHE